MDWGRPLPFTSHQPVWRSIVLVDGDAVDLTNLQRQILHTTERVGTPKAHSGQAALHAINPEVEVTPVAQRVDADALDELVSTRHDRARLLRQLRDTPRDQSGVR